MGFRLPVTALFFLLAGAYPGSAGAADWQKSVTAGAPGPFPQPRSLSATYHFGWAGFTAATAEVHFGKASNDRFEIDGAGRTIGLVRALWRMDVTHHAVADARDLRPIAVKQVEKIRSKKIVTELAFSRTGVLRTRREVKNGVLKSSSKPFNFPNLFDLHTSLLYIRSQPLRDHSVERIVVYPATSAYLATITVIGREKISVAAGTFNAIKFDLQLSKVGKGNRLEPHRKFRRGTIWISDDADRLLLRAEARIFVGSVFAELQSVHFEGATK